MQIPSNSLEIPISFHALSLPQEVLNLVKKAGYTTPTPIQAEGIPLILQGKDLIAGAQTGSGKTAAFLLPLLAKLLKEPLPQANQASSLILVPTRELAVQIGTWIRENTRQMDIKSIMAYGGVKANPQMMRCRGGADIIVATPGRLMDLFNHNAIRFDNLHTLVLDEADRMLNLGFINDLRKINQILPKKRQTLMFSATFPEDVKALAQDFLQSPQELMINPEETTRKEINHYLYSVDKKKKPELLVQLMRENDWKQALVFIKTKRGANILEGFLTKQGFKAKAIHSDKAQNVRTKSLSQFKEGELDILVATDLLARGLDIEELPVVINYHLPKIAEDYTHRIGRTGRAGQLGEAVSFVTAAEFDLLNKTEQQIQQHIERRIHSDFEPVNELKQSKEIKPLKPKKPKKKKLKAQAAKIEIHQKEVQQKEVQKSEPKKKAEFKAKPKVFKESPWPQNFKK